jgi:hypothetical protein
VLHFRYLFDTILYIPAAAEAAAAAAHTANNKT